MNVFKLRQCPRNVRMSSLCNSVKTVYKQSSKGETWFPQSLKTHYIFSLQHNEVLAKSESILSRFIGFRKSLPQTKEYAPKETETELS